MGLFQYDESDSDSEPEEQRPAGPLYVPARPGGAHVVVRLFRTPLGARTAVGFTSPERLAATLGTAQPWIRLSEAALRAMARPLGASLLTIDPALTAPQVTRAGTGPAGALPTRAPETTARTA